MCELLKTVSLVKSDNIKDKTKHKKQTTTKKSCKNVNDKILLSNDLEFLKSLIDK